MSDVVFNARITRLGDARRSRVSDTAVAIIQSDSLAVRSNPLICGFRSQQHSLIANPRLYGAVWFPTGRRAVSLLIAAIHNDHFSWIPGEAAAPSISGLFFQSR